MDTNELLRYLFTPVAQVALIMAIAEIIKKIGLDKRFIPIVDVVLGLAIGIGVYIVYFHMNPVEGTLIGLALGLSACGLFSGTKNVVEKIKED